MTLSVPTIDDRNYETILAEALARIPVHNPQWTNFNDSDPGVTLLQLFAFMSDSLLYRANRIPERNRLQFLSLLDIPLRPAAAAQGLVTFSSSAGQVLTDGRTVWSGNVPFRTQNGLDVLPIETAVYAKQEVDSGALSDDERQLYEETFASFLQPDDRLVYYESTLLAAPVNGVAYPTINLADTLDQSLWIALLAPPNLDVETVRAKLVNKTLTLGVLPALRSTQPLEKVLYPAGQEVAARSQLVYEVPNVSGDGNLPLDPQQRVARYTTLTALPSGDLLTTPGTVEIQLPDSADKIGLWQNMEPTEAGTGDFPPALEEAEMQQRLITWLRVRLQSADAITEQARQLRGQLSWVGVNAARITQRVRVVAENLGSGTGEPDQSAVLTNTPIIPDSVTLTVNGERWREVDDLLTAPPEVSAGTLLSAEHTDAGDPRVFRVDYESGTIRCGDGLRGMRWPSGAILRATYDYGGGMQGNVGIGAITKGATLPAGVKVTNPVRTWGGAEAETVAAAEKRIPRYLQHRDRLVSHADFGDIIMDTPGVDIGRYDILSLVHPDLTDVDAPGVVTIVVIPAHDLLRPNAPQPNRLFLQSICDHLEPRRLITTELHVIGPTYVPIWLSVGIEVIPGTAIAPVREAVKAALQTFLSPLAGGFEANGWPLGKSIAKLELWATAGRVAGVAQITNVLLAGANGGLVDVVPLGRLALPHLVAVDVQIGAPTPLGDLRGESGSTPNDPNGGGRSVAVPLVEMGC